MRNIYQKKLIEDASKKFHDGDFSASRKICNGILTHDPNNSKILHLLSIISLQFNDTKEALDLSIRAQKIKPKDLAINNGLALAYRANGKITKALITLERILENTKPESSFIEEIYANIGLIYYDMENFNIALEFLNKALEKDPKHHTALVNKANTLRHLCKPVQAMKLYDEALNFGLSLETVRKNKINLINYTPNASLKDIYNITINYWDSVSKIKPSILSNVSYSKNTEKKINVGYISPDFRTHTIGYFFQHLLNKVNKEKFNITLYYNHFTNDEVTKSISNNCDKWRSVYKLSDSEIVNKIKSDEIDILIDLAGHTDGNNLSVFRYKPAPIQLTWLGYYATTGLKEIDYIIADKYVLPEKYEYLYTEKPLRLNNSYLCFEPPNINLPLHSKKTSENQNIVFGSFNNIQKVNMNTVRAWSEILNNIQKSFMFIKSPELSNVDIKESFMDLLINNGIKKEKIILNGKTSRFDHLNAYKHIDIILDTFPFNGGMTTAEALWMGIPTIVIEGDRWVSRVGSSILNTVGLDKFICKDFDEYIDKAILLAKERGEREMLHRTLRTIITSSPLCNASMFVKNLEDQLSKKWDEYNTGLAS